MRAIDKIQSIYDDYERFGCDKSSIYFSDLMSAVIDRCRQYLKYTMRGYCIDDINDVLSDSIEFIYRNIDGYGKKSDFIYWAFAVCRRRFCTFYRNNRRHEYVDINGDGMYIESEYDLPDCIAADMLPEHKDRNLFVDKINGLTLKEISDNTGLPIATVKIRLFRYKQNVKKFLKNEVERVSQDCWSI